MDWPFEAHTVNSSDEERNEQRNDALSSFLRQRNRRRGGPLGGSGVRVDQMQPGTSNDDSTFRPLLFAMIQSSYCLPRNHTRQWVSRDHSVALNISFGPALPVDMEASPKPHHHSSS